MIADQQIVKIEVATRLDERVDNETVVNRTTGPDNIVRRLEPETIIEEGPVVAADVEKRRIATRGAIYRIITTSRVAIAVVPERPEQNDRRRDIVLGRLEIVGVLVINFAMARNGATS